LKREAFSVSALVAIGVATCSLLAPQSASALGFSFSFSGVTGKITGLVEGNNPCDTSVCVLTLTNAGASGAPIGVYSYQGFADFEDLAPQGFTVTGGAITGANWTGRIQNDLLGPDPFDMVGALRFVSPTDQYGNPLDTNAVSAILQAGDIGSTPPSPLPANVEAPYPSGVTWESLPEVPTPGPLPLFGAAAAFRFSNTLRNRIKASRTTSATRPVL
jgi:hypothetical protein